jgi:hypothetical protein
MKKILIISFTVFAVCTTYSQQTLFTQLKRLAYENRPEISAENKIIAFNVWSPGDAGSRESNISFEKAQRVYKVAKLKGGEEGIVVFAVSRDEQGSAIILKNDGVETVIPLSLAQLTELKERTVKNLVFDKTGKEIYRNLPPNEIYPAINKLITR